MLASSKQPNILFLIALVSENSSEKAQPHQTFDILQKVAILIDPLDPESICTPPDGKDQFVVRHREISVPTHSYQLTRQSNSPLHLIVFVAGSTSVQEAS